jgi:hypothetical protein
VHSALAQIDGAFADAPRPSNEELLHEQCMDDSDLAYRHFIPAYMGFALRRLDSGAAAVDSTIWSLAPVFYEDPALQDITVSKFSALTEAQREAVIAFLEAVRELGDDYVACQAGNALSWWRA